MIKTTVLVVEYNNLIKNLMTTTLKVNGYNFINVNSGIEAIMEAASHNPDVIIFNLGLLDIEVIKNIRGWSNGPIIIVSARSEDNDKIEALDNGAYDYFTKPFSIDELLAHLRVAERRKNMVKLDDESSIFKNGALKIDYVVNCVYINEQDSHWI